jgi:hypothetical protein
MGAEDPAGCPNAARMFISRDSYKAAAVKIEVEEEFQTKEG